LRWQLVAPFGLAVSALAHREAAIAVWRPGSSSFLVDLDALGRL
jgi:hypothetical protein